MDSQIIMIAVAPVLQASEQVKQISNNCITLDVIYKISTICIAAFNLIFVCFIFIYKNRKEEAANERNRKINLLKTIVLDYNMKHLYLFFDQLDEKTKKLLTPNLTVEQKMAINSFQIEFVKELRQKFIDTLIAIDTNLYNEILNLTDSLSDNLTEWIFDDGILLSCKRKYDELITAKIFETKTAIIKQLFSYKG